MELPDKNDPIWKDIVLGEKSYPLKFLATKILLGRLTRSAKADPSPENIKVNAEQLYAIFANNLKIPSVQDDLETIFG